MRVALRWALLLSSCVAAAAPVTSAGEQLKNLAGADSGAVFMAEPTSVGNGSLNYINDGNESSYWYAGDGQPKSTVLVMLRAPSMVHSVRFLSWATGRHAPCDYRVLTFDSGTGETHVLADVKGDTTRGPKWVEIKAGQPVLADQVMLQVTDVQEHVHGAVLYEFQVLGSGTQSAADAPKLKPDGTYLFVSAGRNLLSQSPDEVRMSVSAGPLGKGEMLWTKSFRSLGFQPVAIDVSKWSGKTVQIHLQASGSGKGDEGVWLAPRVVKGQESIADLVAYWSACHLGSLDGALVGEAKAPNAITCPLTAGKSGITIEVPFSAAAVRANEQMRLELENRRYGASQDRLQPRETAAMQLDLTGHWQMCGQDPSISNQFGTDEGRILPDMRPWHWLEVSVPGSVRSGLTEGGAIEDPYWSDNAGKSLWTEKKDWWFKKSVVIPKSWSGRNIYLGFDGIDYYSSVWINGKFLGDHEGLYGGPVCDVTKLVRFNKPNEIVVQIHPGGTNEPGKVFKGFIFMKWHYLTDISPRGIWRGCRLVATGPVRVENPYAKTHSLTEKEAVLEISADVLNSGKAGKAVLSGTISGENVETLPQNFSRQVNLSPGTQTVTWQLHVANPKLWWPKGMGQPSLYRLKLEASTGGAVSDTISTTFGIRTIEFERNPGLESDVNSRFMCRVNGKLISLRGAGGYGCHDQLYREHARKDAWLINVAEALNYNFIRVHGGGVIASDGFYDLCDRMGMMVWQEFMIANMTIRDEHPEVWRTQTVQSILRLRNHPSLIRWCGGNEFNPDDTGSDNKKIVDTFEQCVAKYDGSRLFARAAQYVNDPHYNDESGDYGGLNPAACTEYAGAYAGSILGERSLRKFLPADDVKRWPPVTKEKIAPFLPSGVAARLDNSRRGAFVFHTALTGRCDAWGWPGDLTILLPQWLFFGKPRSMDEAFEQSQVSGGCTTAYVAETFRSHWPHPSLYASWDFAPIWPMAIIWGPMDYYGSVLPCAYYYKRAQEPLHVLMQLKTKAYVKTPVAGINAFTKIYAPGENFEGQIFVVSDLDHAVAKHTVRAQIFDSNLDLILEKMLDVPKVEQGPSALSLGAFIWSIPKTLPNQVALVCVSLMDADGKLASRSAYPIWISSERNKLISDVAARRDDGPWLTDLKHAKTELKLTAITQEAVFADDDYLPSGDHRCAHICVDVVNSGSKPAFHTGVEITNADCRYICDDNYFVLMPGETKRITLQIDRSTAPFFECVRNELVEPLGSELELSAAAWNAPAEVARIPVRQILP